MATRIVWVTMIAIKGPNHIVRATVGGLAHQARVTPEECRLAIAKLSNPDPDGLSQPYEGRRIQEVEHGWLVLNGEAYKNRRDESYRQNYQAEWVAAKRLREKLSTKTVDVDTPSTSVDTSRADKIREEEREREVADAPTLALVSEVLPKQRKKPAPRPKNWEDFWGFCESEQIKRADAEYLYNHWNANGWMTGKHPIKSWKHAVRTWNSGGFLPSQKPR